MVPACEVMLKEFETLHPEDTVGEAIKRVMASAAGFLPVAGSVAGAVVGMRDLLEGLVAGMVGMADPIRDICSLARVVQETEPVDHLADKGDRFVVQGKDDRFVGILNREMILEILMRNYYEEVENILQCSYDGIYITDGDGVTLRLNEAYERITGVRKELVIGRNMGELVREGIISRSVSLEVIKEKRRVSFNQLILGKKMVLVTGNPVFSRDGRLVKVITNVRDVSELVELKRAFQKLQDQDGNKGNVDTEKIRVLAKEAGIVFKSEKMLQALSMAYRAAQVDCRGVYITGESGVGKELFVNFIHRNSSRKNGPFVKINCAAIPENLLESELFGYENGAFTGANAKGKKGLFEVADGGTLFLDEIGDLPLGLQAKLLRVLENNEVQRLGSTRPISIDVRVVAATNRDIPEMIRDNRFREDLYYRLSILPIQIPPLRERKEDITALVDYFLDRLNQRYKFVKNVSKEVLEVLEAYDWPGNVRQLANEVERAWITSDGDQVTMEDLSDMLVSAIISLEKAAPPITVNRVMSLQEAVETVERELISEVLRDRKSFKSAASVLGVDRTTILRKARKYGILLN